MKKKRKTIRINLQKLETPKDLKIGDKLRMIPESFYIISEPREPQLRPCTVVYINWAHRFFTVEFELKTGNKFLESYKFTLKGEQPPCTSKARARKGNAASAMVSL